MLPDFPKHKAKLMEFWHSFLASRERHHLGYFATAPTYVHHEGDRWTILSPDGVASDSTYSQVEAPIEIPTRDIPDLTPSGIAAKLDEAAEALAGKMAQKMIRDVTEAARKRGGAIGAAGKPLTMELVLEALERVRVEFDRHGNAHLPSIMMNPQLWEAKGAEMKAWEDDPEFKARYGEMMARKREEWRARESRRKLVD